MGADAGQTDEQVEAMLSAMNSAAGQTAWLEHVANTIGTMIEEGEADRDQGAVAQDDPVLLINARRSTLHFQQAGLLSLTVRRRTGQS